MTKTVLDTKFTKDRTVLYLDGKTTKEKERTAELRRQVKERDLKKMEDLLHKAEDKAMYGKRLSGAQISSIHRLCRRAFSLTPNMKSILAEEALATGWTIVDCLGEADVHIGGLTLTDEDVVVSGDSDMLFYDSVQHVLRLMARRSFHTMTTYATRPG